MSQNMSKQVEVTVRKITDPTMFATVSLQSPEYRNGKAVISSDLRDPVENARYTDGTPIPKGAIEAMSISGVGYAMSTAHIWDPAFRMVSAAGLVDHSHEGVVGFAVAASISKFYLLGREDIIPTLVKNDWEIESVEIC